MARIDEAAQGQLSDGDKSAIDVGNAPVNRIKLMAHCSAVGDADRSYQAAVETSGGTDPVSEEIMAVTALRRCPYELKKRLPTSKETGVSDAMIDAILAEDWTDSCFDPGQKAAFRYALMYDAGHGIHPEAFEALCEHFDPAAIVQLSLVCGYWGGTARFSIGLGIEIET